MLSDGRPPVPSDILEIHDPVRPAEPALGVPPVSMHRRFRPPSKRILDRSMQPPLQRIRDESPDGGHLHEAVPRRARRDQQRRMVRVAVDQEAPVGRVCVPAYAGEHERTVREVRHRVAEEVTHAGLGLARDLVPREGDAPFLTWMIWVVDPVAVSRVFVADLELVPVRVGLHEEALGDVEQHGEVPVPLGLVGRHPDVGERPRRRAELLLEVEEAVAVGARCEDGMRCAV